MQYSPNRACLPFMLPNIKLIKLSSVEFTDQGNIKGAERLCRRALCILEKSNMGFHVQTGAVLVALAGLLHKKVPPPPRPVLRVRVLRSFYTDVGKYLGILFFILKPLFISSSRRWVLSHLVNELAHRLTYGNLPSDQRRPKHFVARVGECTYSTFAVIDTLKSRIGVGLRVRLLKFQALLA